MTRFLVAGCAWVAILVAAPTFAQDGAALYTQRCASCHEGGQIARAPARDVIAVLTPDRIVGALETGTMRVQGETLTPDQRRAIANYLSTSRPAPAAAANAPVTGPRCETASPSAAYARRSRSATRLTRRRTRPRTSATCAR